MNYGLPTSVEINGKEFAIRSDYRAALDIMACMVDPDLSETDKAEAVLIIFYEDYDLLEDADIAPALKECVNFIRCGEDEPEGKQTKLIDWEQDIKLVIAPINRVAGCDVRSMEYLHWWSFMAYFQEIGDCLFSQVVAIRNKKAMGKTLDKMDREFYNRNRAIIDFKHKYTEADNALLENWVKGVQ